jgi:hypothetical protein
MTTLGRLLTPRQEKSQCLNREAERVQRHAGLRRNRKALLQDLSTLVKKAKTLQEILVNEKSDQTLDDDYLDDMILKAFSMVVRAVKFYDIWVEEVGNTRGIEIEANTTTQPHANIPPTPPPDANADGNESEQGLEQPATHCTSTASSSSDYRNPPDCRDHASTNGKSSGGRNSKSYVRPGSSQYLTARPQSINVNRRSTSHRISSTLSYSAPRNELLASEKLTQAHEVFLGYLRCFIDLHISSRTSSEVLVTTQHALHAGRALLNIVEAVWERDSRRSASLGVSRDSMYTKMANLVEATRDAFGPLSEKNTNVKYEVDHGKRLADAATACIRDAGDCTAKARFVLDLIGDFEFEDSETPPFEHTNFFERSGSALDEEHSEHDNSTIRASSIPPRDSSVPSQPAHEPPSPPPVNNTHTPTPTPLKVDTTFVTTKISNIQITHFTPPSQTQRHSDNSMLGPLPTLSATRGHENNDSPAFSSYSSRGSALGARTESSSTPSTYVHSGRDSNGSIASSFSTVANSDADPSKLNGLTSLSSSFSEDHTALDDECEAESHVMQKTYAHELLFNKDGQVSGGSLPALIERLTTGDATPDAFFVSTFFLTFRLFATPITFARALIERYVYAGNGRNVAGPVQLRVYNVFKGWLETHWRIDCDGPALELILPFANRQLAVVLPDAAKRLVELAIKVNSEGRPLVPRLVSSIGKTNTSVAEYIAPNTPMPPPIFTKSQMGLLCVWKRGGGYSPTILDFDPLELARQITIKESALFCSILPEELLASEWTKKNSSMAVNVRLMSTLSTDLANLVADTILQMEDVSKRAKIIKQWIKIGAKCLELNNYDSLMAIICSLNSTTILRLKKTWDMISSKTKSTLESLKNIVDISMNHKNLRARLATCMPPTLPFVGIYLTDLTFVDIGNQNMRLIDGQSPQESISVINFDKHVKTAKIISELQRFQVPYRLQEIPEMQAWMQDQLVKVRSSDESTINRHYRRSLLLEPREQNGKGSVNDEPPKKDLFQGMLSWTNNKKDDMSDSKSTRSRDN